MAQFIVYSYECFQEEVEYFGQTITLTNRRGKELNKIIKKGWKNFWVLKA